MMHDLSFIHTRHFAHLSAEQINHGDCYAWAWLARAYVGEQAELCLAYRIGHRETLVHGHAFVRFDHHYYDAERPFGVQRQDALPGVRALGRRRWLCVGVAPEMMRRFVAPVEDRRRTFQKLGLAPWPDALALGASL